MNNGYLGAEIKCPSDYCGTTIAKAVDAAEKGRV